MTLNRRVTDDQVGRYYRKMLAIGNRLGKSLPFDETMSALQRIHDGQCDPIFSQFSTWKTLVIGGICTEQLLRTLGDCFVSDYALQLIKSDAFTTLPKPEKIDLALVEVGKDLGFTEMPTTDQLWSRIRDLGHDLCPSETAVYLRLEGDYKSGDCYWTAMERIASADGNPSMFHLERSDGGEWWLLADWRLPSGAWPLNRRLVVRRRRPLQI